MTSVVVPHLEIQMAAKTPERIAHFSDTYLPRRCGVLTSMGVLTGALAEAGVKSLTVVPSHPELAERAGLFQLPSLPSGVVGLRLAWPGKRQLERVAAWRPDLVHVHTPGPAGLLGVLVGRQLDVPVVHTHHSDAQSQAVANQAPALMARVGLRLFAARLGTSVPPTAPGLTGAIDGVLALLMRDADAVIVPGRSVSFFSVAAPG
ncbi:glycosyltransferase [Streptomyces sp. NBC_00988]|uniref:glycosyltransferase n=1 Tax=Streptomyces sp. NBC_00988 TaxID=2903704 RepID=UPI0038637811|nr:glycosyltransferase [Streptomyces sp. NBC_00988]